MEAINLDFINFSPDFKNENMQPYALELFNKIKKKDNDFFEQFGFNELVLNFDLQNLKELNNFSELFHSQNIKNIIIFCKKSDKDNFKAANDFLNKNDILKDQKIKYSFFCDEEPEIWQKLYIKNQEIINNSKTAFLFIGQSLYSEPFIEIIKIMINDIQEKYGYYRALKRCFMICKQKLEVQLQNFEIDEKNKLIMPNVLTKNYSFFAESNLFLLLLKGCDIMSLVSGYQNLYPAFVSDNLEENIAFQYAYVRSLISKKSKYNFIINDNNVLSNLFVLQANMENNYYDKFNVFSYIASFTNDIYTYGQFLIDNYQKMYISFYKLKNEKIDYRLSDEIHFSDGLNQYPFTKISDFRKSANNGIQEILTNILGMPYCLISIDDNSEYSLGAIIAFLYWSFIYRCMLNNTNPFLINHRS
ncbi:glucose-6-phosphate isomerase [Mycoplasmopsis agalactiae]|uniref:glucose-6-phosphate isomerase n=1 Tax=Mycoplasmopsis agalactiae TaxID=2110 RepID=UPI001F39BC79|nr:glucose-6-phosphate isomerase [Mycoplasmopsis agalactiae]MCE6061596.1 glucose-6-phosphate isomerase [Mycoplasmopsis agalactiae]